MRTSNGARGHAARCTSQDATECAEDDWERDARGGSELGREAFCDALFEVCPQVTATRMRVFEAAVFARALERGRACVGVGMGHDRGRRERKPDDGVLIDSRCVRNGGSLAYGDGGDPSIHTWMAASCAIHGRAHVRRTSAEPLHPPRPVTPTAHSRLSAGATSDRPPRHSATSADSMPTPYWRRFHRITPRGSSLPCDPDCTSP